MSFKIHWLCAAPSPYNDYLFQTLAADREIDLLVHFRKRAIPSHPWRSAMAQGFPNRCYKKVFGFDKKLLSLAVKDKKSLFVVAGWNHPTAWAVLNTLMIQKRPFVIWTDTPNFHKGRAWVKDKLRSNWLKIIFNNAVLVMGTGRSGVEALEKMGCPKKKVINFPYWVPLPKEWESNKQSFRDSIKFFAIGQLIARKGYDLAINALGKIVGHCKKQNIEFWIFGDGPERNNLESLSKQMGLIKIVKFYGWREPEFIQKKIKKANILVHPALWEAYGVVVLEAMAHGKAVIGSDGTMAALDRIKHGVNGFICKNRNVDQLAECMAVFIENPDEIDKMGREARRTAEEWPVELGVEIIKGIAQRGVG